MTISNICVILFIVERHKTPTEIDWFIKSFYEKQQIKVLTKGNTCVILKVLLRVNRLPTEIVRLNKKKSEKLLTISNVSDIIKSVKGKSNHQQRLLGKNKRV